MEATTPAYPTRLSNTQWETLAAYFAADSQLGRPRNTNLPALVEAILYVLRAGSGACCRGTFRRGRPCMATSDAGAITALGSAFTATCAPWVRLRCKRPSRPVWPSPIRSRAAGRCLSRKLSHRLMHSVTLELVPFQSDSA